MQIKDLTTEEFKSLLKETFDEILKEYLSDPDEGLEIREDIKQSLLEMKKEKEAGVRGIPAEEVARKFGLG